MIKRMDLQDPQIARLIEALGTDVEAGSPAGPLFGESIAMALSAHIARHYSVQKSGLEQYRGGLSRSKLKNVQEYVNSHLGDKLELETLASVAGCRPAYAQIDSPTALIQLFGNLRAGLAAPHYEDRPLRKIRRLPVCV